MNRQKAGHRLFFALLPPDRTREAICRIQKRIDGGAGRAVPPERLHATLLFLGDTSPRALERLLEIGPQVVFPPFSLLLDHVGHFPRTAVAWLGARQVPEVLPDLVSRLGELVSGTGIGFDAKKFTLHVTLYRNLRTRPGIIRFEPVEWPVDEYVLMESVHSQRGLQYQCRGRWPATQTDN